MFSSFVLPSQHKQHHMLSCLWLIQTATLFAVLGCAGVADPLGRQAISGTVTLDGAPLKNGTIRFEPFGTQKLSTATGAIITGGSYSIQQSAGLPPGKYAVSISSHGDDAANSLPADPQEAMNAAAQAKPAEELIPAKYNTQTEQVVEVTKGGDNKFIFEITSVKK